MDLSLLDTLKDKLVHAEKFSDVLNYFFDHFGDDPAFIALGERTTDAFIEAVLQMVGKQLFGGNVRLTNVLLTRLPEKQFLHGACTINGQLGNIFYFDDIQVGLLSVVMLLPSNETKMVRFTGRRQPPGGAPSSN